MTTSTILHSIDTWFLRRQRLNEYAILTLTGYQEHYMPCRPIYCPTSELYRYDGIPLRRHIDRSISIDIGQLHWQILMKKHHFDIVSKWQRYVGPTYRPISNVMNTIQFRWEHDIDQSMLEIGLQHRIRGRYAIMISFRYRYSYVESI